VIKISLTLDKDRLKVISAIVADAGQVFLASIVIPFFTGIDKVGFPVLLSGLALTIVCWTTSIILAKKRNRR